MDFKNLIKKLKSDVDNLQGNNLISFNYQEIDMIYYVPFILFIIIYIIMYITKPFIVLDNTKTIEHGVSYNIQEINHYKIFVSSLIITIIIYILNRRLLPKYSPFL